MEWTKAQESAISSRGKDLAVIAAAGSGKTAVLTQRLVSLLSEEDGVDAARLAVVTFTRDAAGELEGRLLSALSEKAGEGENRKHLTRQLFRLSRAQISTIHSFAFSLIREHKKELDLGEKIRIASQEEADLMQKKAADQAIEAFFSRKDNATEEEKEALYRLFGNARDSSGLAGAIVSLEKKASSYPGFLSLFHSLQSKMEGELFLIREGKKSFFDTPFGLLLVQNAISLTRQGSLVLSHLSQSLDHTQAVGEYYMDELANRSRALEDCCTLLSSGKRMDALFLLRETFEKNLPTVRKCPEEELEIKTLCQENHNEKVKKPLLALYEDLFCRAESELTQDLDEMLSLTGRLLSVTEEAAREYAMAKRKKGVLDYGDLEHMTLSLLYEKQGEEWVLTPLAKKIAAEFDAVFVDEYQDTNRIQDMIFRAVSEKGKRFLVGDPKQSIYRFRGADPSVFAEYKNSLETYPHPGDGMQKILLSDNFRCDESVIDLVNRIFRVVMDETGADSLYQEEDRLRFSKKSEKRENTYPAEIVLVEEGEWDEDDSPDREENAEAAYVAQRIGEMLSGREEKAPGEAFLPKDIAVICRTHMQTARIREALSARNIPTSLGKGDDLKQLPEYLFVTSLLSALDNPTQDIPLLGALSSPAFRFSPDDLYRIRKEKKGVGFYSALCHYAKEGKNLQTQNRCLEALETFSRMRREAKEISLSAFLFSLYRRFAPEEMFPNQGIAKGAVKEALLAAVEQAEGMGIASLGEFCRFLDQAELPGAGNGQGVQLLTVHKSKGLEFPVVFTPFLAQAFPDQDESTTMLISPEMGVFLPVPKLGGRAKMNPLCRKAARLNLHRESIEEEKRILYVALTRARTRLILTFSGKRREALAKELLLVGEKPLSPLLSSLLVSNAPNPITMILLALRQDPAVRRVLQQGGEAFWGNLRVKTASPGPMTLFRQEETKEDSPLFSPEEVLENLRFVYENRMEETLPEKLSVSQILRDSREEEEPGFYPRRLMDFEKGVLKSGAEKIGTATHQVMQFASFEAMEQDPEGEFTRLVEQGFLSPEDMALVEKEKVIAFFSSPLYEKMKSSPLVEHEKRFNVLLSAEEIGIGKGEVLVQGVVDAWFENPDGTLSLLDFKTDRVKGEEGEKILLSRHSRQLWLYGLAVEKLTGKKVTAKYLYSFALQKAIPC